MKQRLRIACSLVTLGVLGVVVAGFGSPAVAASPAGAHRWVDEPIRFEAGGVEVYGTFRHPAGGSGHVPAVLLVAGSGPTDGDGNSPLIAGRVDTLLTLAHWLSDDGVASLRYDKLASGRTGLGPFANHPDAVGIAPFEQEAVAGLTFLSNQREVDRSHLAVIGHSEGALFALLLATGAAGPTPPIHALGLLEPLSRRYLDVISEQLDAQLSTALSAKRLTPQAVEELRSAVAAIITDLRVSGTLPANVPSTLRALFNPSTSKFLSEADRYDPARLGSELPKGFPLLVSCSDADVQVSCADVDRLTEGLHEAGANVDFVRLSGVDHVLKEDSSRTAAGYGSPLPFSSELQKRLRSFVARALHS